MLIDVGRGGRRERQRQRQRGRMLTAAADILKARAESLARKVAEETGNAIRTQVRPAIIRL